MKYHKTLMTLKRQKVAFLLLLLEFKTPKRVVLNAKKENLKLPYFGI